MPATDGRAELTPNLEDTMSRKSKMPPPMPQPADESTQGFTIWIHLRRGISPRSEQAFERDLADYLESRSLLWWGTQLHAEVGSDDHELTETDQVDLLFWLIESPTSATVEIGQLGPHTGMPACRGSLPVVRVQSSDLMLVPMMWLYRAGRIKASHVLEMLGGYAMTSPVH
jgi:hypothetical protein